MSPSAASAAASISTATFAAITQPLHPRRRIAMAMLRRETASHVMAANVGVMTFRKHEVLLAHFVVGGVRGDTKCFEVADGGRHVVRGYEPIYVRAADGSPLAPTTSSSRVVSKARNTDTPQVVSLNRAAALAAHSCPSVPISQAASNAITGAAVERTPRSN